MFGDVLNELVDRVESDNEGRIDGLKAEVLEHGRDGVRRRDRARFVGIPKDARSSVAALLIVDRLYLPQQLLDFAEQCLRSSNERSSLTLLFGCCSWGIAESS